MRRAERLLVEREQPMSLQVPERTVIRQHVESIARPLERPARFVTTVDPVPDVAGEDRGPVLGRQSPGEPEQLIVGKGRRRVEGGRNDLGLPVGIVLGQRDFLAILCRGGSRRVFSDGLKPVPRAGQIFDPSKSARRLVYAREKG